MESEALMMISQSLLVQPYPRVKVSPQVPETGETPRISGFFGVGTLQRDVLERGFPRCLP